MSPSVAVVIPACDAAAFLGQALDSVRAQSRQPDEVWVVDDASGDDTSAIAERGGARVLRLPRNQGPAAARNAGIRAARTDLVAFLDADDWWLPEHLELVVGALRRHASGAVASTYTQVSRLWQPSAASVLPADVPFDALTHLLRANFVVQSAACARRDALLGAGGYDAGLRLAEDYDLWLRLALRSHFVFLPHVTVMRRLHAAQASRDGARMAEETWRLRAVALDRLRACDASPCARRAAQQALRLAADGELRDMWRGGDADVLDHLLRVVAQHDAVRDVARAWRRRRLLWPGWRVLRALRWRLRLAAGRA